MLEIPVGMDRTLREIRSQQHQHCSSLSEKILDRLLQTKITFLSSVHAGIICTCSTGVTNALISENAFEYWYRDMCTS